MTQNLALFRTARGSALAKMIASCSGLDEQLSDIDILRVWLNVKLGLDARSRFFVVFDRDTDEYQKIHKIISKTPLLLFIRAYATSLVSDPDGLSILFRKSESELDSTVAIGILSVHEKNPFDDLENQSCFLTTLTNCLPFIGEHESRQSFFPVSTRWP